MLEKVIRLPGQFTGGKMSAMAREVTADRFWPDAVTFDFSTLQFIRPVGVVFLRNLVRWLHAKNCRVLFDGHTGTSRALLYLQDSQFFRLHIDGHYEEEGACRPTTRPLIDVQYQNSQAWIRTKLIPWLSDRAGASPSALYGLQSAIVEIFNNIIDHSRYDIGSVFGQHFPNENLINIAISDMGVGIPNTVRTLRSGMSDAQAILSAVEEGFTSKSVATNMGMGLDQLLRAVVVALGGKVTIYSGTAIVVFSRRNENVVHSVNENIGFCPGTTIEISLDPRQIPDRSEDEEDIKW